MRVLHVCHTNYAGGAGIAAARLHSALMQSGVGSTMMCSVVKGAEPNTFCDRRPGSALMAKARRYFSRKLLSLSTADPSIGPASLGLLPTRLSSVINTHSCDVVNLHWINNEMMSIFDIARIKKPVVWTCHDLWPASGIYHYHPEQSYNVALAQSALDAWVMRLKRHTLGRRPGHVVAPSHWMAARLSESPALQGWTVHVVGNPLDEQLWQAYPRELARAQLMLPKDYSLVGFGSYGTNNAFHKGGDMLNELICRARASTVPMKFVVFGGGELNLSDASEVIDLGPIPGETKMNILLSALDCLVVPSRIDNLPNIAVEATYSGTPIVGFDTGGMSDIVKEGVNGFLAPSFDVKALAQALLDVVSARLPPQRVREASISRFRASSRAADYEKVYAQALAGGGG